MMRCIDKKLAYQLNCFMIGNVSDRLVAKRFAIEILVKLAKDDFSNLVNSHERNRSV